MRYKNASDLIPPTLLAEVQKYVSGELIYIPSGHIRRKWGEGSGAREFYASRNEEIRRKYFEKVDMETLSEEYALSLETIRKIVFR